MEIFGSFGGKSIAKISYDHPTFLTPDGPTFSMWSAIYFFQSLFVILQIIPRYQNAHAGIVRARFWVILLYIFCCLWAPVFCHEVFWPAFALLLAMIFSLVMIYRALEINYGAVDRTQSTCMMLHSVILEEPEQTRARVGNNDGSNAVTLHSWFVKVLCFTGFSLHLSCLVFTAFVDFLLTTGTMGWQQPYAALHTPNLNASSSANTTTTTSVHFVSGSENFAIMCVCIIGAIACLMAVRNCDVPFATGTAWALGGVYRGQTFNAPRGYPDVAMSESIANWTLAIIIVVGVASVIGLVKAIAESVFAHFKSTEQQNNDDGYYNFDSQYESLPRKNPSIRKISMDE